MKKILSLALAALMMVSALPVAYAAEWVPTSDTQVTVEGPGGEYEITVPATLSAGQVGTVTAKGYWSNSQFLSVANITPNIIVTNTKTAQTTRVNVFFDNIESMGDDLNEMNLSADISIDTGDTKFGTWTGIIDYIVVLCGVGEECYINGQTYYFDGGMTWADWVGSDYNTDGIYIDADTNQAMTADGIALDSASNYVLPYKYGVSE